MKKIFFVLIILSVFFVIASLLFLFTKKNFYVKEKESNSVPSALENKNSSDVAGSSEGSIFQGDEIIGSSEDYEIITSDYEGNKIFIIFIKRGNPHEIRKVAEEAFLVAMNLSKEEACTKDVSLFVSEESNQKLSGKNYGLSFCPNGVDFDAIKRL